MARRAGWPTGLRAVAARVHRLVGCVSRCLRRKPAPISHARSPGSSRAACETRRNSTSGKFWPRLQHERYQTSAVHATRFCLQQRAPRGLRGWHQCCGCRGTGAACRVAKPCASTDTRACTGASTIAGTRAHGFDGVFIEQLRCNCAGTVLHWLCVQTERCAGGEGRGRQCRQPSGRAQEPLARWLAQVCRVGGSGRHRRRSAAHRVTGCRRECRWYRTDGR